MTARRPLAGARVTLSVTAPSSAEFLVGQLAALREAGAAVSLLTTPSAEAEALCAREGAALLPVRMERAPAPRRDLAALGAATRALRAWAPDLVVAGTPKAGLIVMLAAAAARVPIRVHTLHGLRFEAATGAQRRLLWAAQRASCLAATDVVCVSRSLRLRAIETGVVSAGRATVIGDGSVNGIDLSRFDPDRAEPAGRALRARLGVPPAAPVVGYVGRLARDKGVEDLVRAWSRLRDGKRHLILAGERDATDPVPAASLRELHGHADVHVLGHCDVVPVYASMDVLVLPTYREGMPTAPLEAAAMRVPVVATQATGCVDAVLDDTTGVLVPIGDVDALAREVERYLADPTRRDAHGAAGRARVVARFGSDRVQAATISYLAGLLTRERTSP